MLELTTRWARERGEDGAAPDEIIEQLKSLAGLYLSVRVPFLAVSYKLTRTYVALCRGGARQH